MKVKNSATQTLDCHMTSTNRREVAQWAIQVLALQVKANGLHHPATPDEPSHWDWQTGDADLCLTEQVLPHPGAQALENVVDVWAGTKRRKVFSVSWTPESPWISPVVRNYKAGDWLRELGYTPS